MTTIRTVAARAGVSPATVSRVFAQPDIVAPDTRRQVLAAAEALGYRPNPVARNLSRGRTGALGLVVPDIANPFFAPMIKSVQAQARRHDRALFLADSDEDVNEELELARAMARQVDGLVLASPRLGEEHLRQILEVTPLVVVNRDVADVPAVLTPPDNGLAQAVDHLVALGHETLVYLAGPAASYSNAERRRALHAACTSHEVRLRELGPFAPRFEAGVRAADVVLAAGATGVIAYNDQVALGLMSRLETRGCRPGRDLSVVGIDDSWIAALSSPPLTSVRVPAGAAGAAAVRLLVDAVDSERDDAAAPRVELPTELVVRASTGPAPSRHPVA